jgi:leucyl aminopeptidase
MANGKTVEVLNTDAEGRLILADALYHATEKYKLKACVDVATLTGACKMAVADAAAGLFTRSDGVKKALMKASEDTAENLFPLPDFEEFYGGLLKSEVADMRNIGLTRDAGATTASYFLKEFIHKDTPWAHIDIAGCGWYDRPRDFVSIRGASGVPIRLLARFVESYA